MTAQVERHRWTTEGFLRAWEAGAFDDARVEMVDGEVWPVSIGSWHGTTTGRVARGLPNSSYEVTSESLVMETSVVDPDVWVRRADARPRAKARLYAAAGFGLYWVVGRDGVHEHSGPTSFGYRTVRTFWPGEAVPVRCASTSLDVAALVGTSAPG